MTSSDFIDDAQRAHRYARGALAGEDRVADEPCVMQTGGGAARGEDAGEREAADATAMAARVEAERDRRPFEL